MKPEQGSTDDLKVKDLPLVLVNRDVTDCFQIHNLFVLSLSQDSPEEELFL
jgi:hypothetical protein